MKKNKYSIFFSFVLILAMLISFSMDSFSDTTSDTPETSVKTGNSSISVYLMSGKDIKVNGVETKKIRTYPNIRVKIWKINDSTEPENENSNENLRKELDRMKEKSSDEKNSSDQNTLDGKYTTHYEKNTNSDGSVYFDKLDSGTYYIRADKYLKKEKSDKDNNDSKKTEEKDKDKKDANKEEEEDVDLDFATSVCQIKNAENKDIFLKGSHHTTHGHGGGGGGGGGGGDTPQIEDKKGGMKFLKLDNETKKILPGAKFTVSKLVNGNYEIVKRNGKDLILESDAYGKFSVKDLEFGDYYLTETVSPKNNNCVYGLLIEPFKFTINEKSYDSEPITVYDKPTFNVITEIKNRPDQVVPGKTDTTEPGKTPQYQTNSKITIPRTGDVQIFYYSLLGAVIFFIGMYITMKESNKKSGAES